MNPRIPVIGVVGAFAVVILIVAYSGTSVIDDTSGEARLGSSSGAVIEPLVIDLDEIIIKDVDERTAYVEIAFKVTNPNYKSGSKQLWANSISPCALCYTIPELWKALEDGNPQWRVSGEAYYNLSSMTAGGENEITFEFTR